MNNTSRVIATFFIWAAFAGVAISVSITRSGDLTAIIFILSAAALFSTLAVWVSGAGQRASDSRQERTALRQERIEKAKRMDRSRVARLADVLDDEEALALLSELQARLEGETDGEMVSLEDLLAQRESEQRQVTRR